MGVRPLTSRDAKSAGRAGIPTYGVSGIFNDEDDYRAHGRSERILVKSFDDAVDFIYDLVTRLAM
jgi:acetylornithine deacetylase/succinyl-diaminopimelate desuccinylase-like protein